ncbi:MFS transporter [Streptomyces caniscabiei]|uniref:MFS transporter n=1 Tax=Streptomyces caniscabiei TaxID=2746961 RepID=A0A927L891_9ACTN|nr:MFS transporter [Streptomyces caniscabiei]MBD9727069.1 MFS transporter [Streptomyces caniscabiei]MDX3516008.1 MFS transporter [Streptomyces caniscabiei]MDX3725186.1 MFS transporter [Streptomyces caniscabiei]WEO23481.1 MFS transporter [Streptomyces caniscabiei]
MPDTPTAQEVKHIRPAPETRVFSPAAVVASCVGFVLIGVLQALYGPAIPALRDTYDLSPSAAGLGLSAHFTGGVAGVLLFDRLYGRMGNRRILGTSYLLMALGAAGFALAPSWPVGLAAALLAGLGFGGIDYGLNQLFAVGFGHRSTAMLNVLNAHFGIGAILGPALIAAVGAEHYPALFLAFAAVTLPLLFCLRGVRDQVPQPTSAVTATTGVPGSAAANGSALGRSLGSVLSVFVTLYVLHVGIEAGVGGWEPTHLETVGYGAGAAATATSVYWLMMTVGRFLVVPLALRHSAQTIITVSCAGMTVCLLLASVPSLAPYAYAGVGLFIAPIFPTGLPWLNAAAPRARRAGAVVIAASMIGGVAAGPALGKAIEWSGVRSVPLLLGAVSAVCLAATLWLIRATRSTSGSP